MDTGDIVFLAKEKAAYKQILRPAHNFRNGWDVVPMLWGDRAYIIEKERSRLKLSAKGHHFWAPARDFTTQQILSVWQIDCGQGDAALVNLPDDRWLLVDGGPHKKDSNSGPTALSFLYWLNFVDFSWRREFQQTRQSFHIDGMVSTHPDFDHYGGLMDLHESNMLGLSSQSTSRNTKFSVGTYFHNGMGRFGGPVDTQLGPLVGDTAPDLFLSVLIDGFPDVGRYLSKGPGRTWTLNGRYRTFLSNLLAKLGSGVGSMRRVSHRDGHLPGYNDGPCTIKLLGPVVEEYSPGKEGLRFLDDNTSKGRSSPSLTRNGHSVVMRLDYGEARILLTGDLNFRSQALMMQHIESNEFACDVAKACHHGSEDISWKFLQAVSPVATMFSCGDNNSYAHPRARALGLAAHFSHKVQLNKTDSYLGFSEPRLSSPLLYCTELSRSVELWKPRAVYDSKGTRVRAPQIEAQPRVRGGVSPKMSLSDWRLADKLVYGLINVRTDGEKVLLGALKDDKSSFQVETFKAGQWRERNG